MKALRIIARWHIPANDHYAHHLVAPYVPMIQDYSIALEGESMIVLWNGKEVERIPRPASLVSGCILRMDRIGDEVTVYIDGHQVIKFRPPLMGL